MKKNNESLDWHKHPDPLTKVLKAASKAKTGSLLLVKGQFRPSGETLRLGIFQKQKCLYDGWVNEQDLEALATELEKNYLQLRWGEWDVMYATAWSYLWTKDDGPIEVYDSKGPILYQVASHLEGRNLKEPIELDAVVSAEAYLSADWVTRGVKLNCQDGREVKIAEVQDGFVLLDPCYDAINLVFEAAWTVSLAKGIGSALGVKTIIDEELE